MRFLAAVLLGVTLVTPSLHAPLGAQSPTPEPAADSLRERLEDLEAAVQALKEQLAADAGTAVRTRSRVGMEFHGRVLVHALHTSALTNNADLPLFVSVPLPVAPFTTHRPGGSTISMRQTMLGLALTASDILGADFVGDLDVDFFGGQFSSSGGRHFPLLRLRTARAALMWDRFTLMAGQDQPLFTDLDPVSLATIGTPGFANAGNLWLWLPQLRASYESKGALRIGAQAAILAPVVESTVGATGVFAGVGTFNTGFDAAERSRWPTLQARLSAKWGADESRGEIGLGVHSARVRTRADSVEAKSEAVAVTALLPFGRILEVRGEYFTGQLLSGLGGGGIGQPTDALGNPWKTVGGWAQVNVRPTLRWLFSAGYGVDDPERVDVPPAQARLRNQVHSLATQWTPAGPIIVGLEWRKLATTYATGVRKADHINLALGFTF